MKQFTFRGLMAPVFTPFDDDKIINFEVIPQYAEYLHSKGITGVLVNGTTGEGVSLTTQERKAVLECWVKACKPHAITIMAQIGGTNMKDVKNLAKHAEELNVSSILCLADLFFRPSNVGDLIHYLKTISVAAPKTPLLYYHIPSFTGININMRELLKRSGEIPTFAGIKFTDNDLAMGSSCVNVSEKLAVFLGCDTLLLPAMIQGFDSAIGTTINIFPDENKEILSFYQKGEIQKAAAVQKKLNSNIEQIIEQGSWVSSMKMAMKMMTPIDVGGVRDPLIEAKPSPSMLKK